MPGSAINSPLFQVILFKFSFKNTFHNVVFVLNRSNVDINTTTQLLLFLILLSQLDYIYFAYRFLSSHNLHNYNIIYGTLNFHIPCLPLPCPPRPAPPPYKRKIWDYKTAKTDLICNDLKKNTNWHDLFFNLNVNEMNLVFSVRLMEIFSKQISNKIISCNDRDAPWITPKLKTAIKRNVRVYRKWVKRGRNENDHNNVREVQNTTNRLIREAKHVHYKKLGEKLADTQTGSKHFWNAFIRITNKRKHTKIPPIIDNNTYVSNFQQKANIFNDYFANQCKILENSSTLPEVTLNTNASIYHAKITINNIVGIISKNEL